MRQPTTVPGVRTTCPDSSSAGYGLKTPDHHTAPNERASDPWGPAMTTTHDNDNDDITPTG